MSVGTPDAPAFPDPAAEAAWRAAVAKALKGEDFDARLPFRTGGGTRVEPLYPPSGAPAPAGARPPARIIARLDDAAVDPVEELENGADGLTLVFAGADTARGFGLDAAEIGAALAGVAIDTLPLRLEPAPFGGLDAVRALLDAAEARRVPPGAIELDAGVDPLGSMARTGEAPKAWPELGGLVAEVFGALRDRGLAGRLLRADGRPHHEAGATEAQELAAALGTALACLRALDGAGVPLADGRDALSFTLTADADLFATVAKLRALRRLWARVEADCGLDPRPLRLHAETSWRMLARRDPPTNLLRNAVACAGALVGDADTVAALPHTAPLGLADPFARRLARNAALVLRDEAGLDRVADPGAGSGAVEALTEAFCAEAWDLFASLERAGGLPAALADGCWGARAVEALTEAFCAEAWDLFASLERAGGLPAALADGSWGARLAVAQGARAADLAAGRRAVLGTTLYPLAAEAPQAVLRPAPPFPARGPAALPCLRDDQLLGAVP